ncbi:uncharacterized protein LOC133193157 [Saccostrea echinata]|uniref:uncharacterized protein LOC133193157 n=1 Tax=Saccostrea echinata TaxID=191078 RepID=UPI002A80D687|nr:uncharacterized protein LOC133193157 [Saccostrea echinata]
MAATWRPMVAFSFTMTIMSAGNLTVCLYNINKLKMFNQHVVLFLSVCLCAVSAVPVGLLPPIQNAAPDPGRLAGVVTSTYPANFYRWLLQLFTQRSFVTWLGRTRGLNFQPRASPFSGGTSDLSTGGTRDPVLTARLEEGDPRVSKLKVVRDYLPPASLPKTITAPKPTVQRDFQANDIIIPQTAEPKKGPGIIQIPVLSLKGSGGLVDDSPTPSPATLPGDLVIIRDHLKKDTTVEPSSATAKPFHSRLSESKPATEEAISREQTVTRTGVQKTTSSNLEDFKVERDQELLSLSQEKSTVQVTIPLTEKHSVSVDNEDLRELSVQRDRKGSYHSNTLPPDLVIIRDSVADEESGHFVTTRGVTEPGVAFSTQPVGSGIIILLPSGGKK